MQGSVEVISENIREKFNLIRGALTILDTVMTRLNAVLSGPKMTKSRQTAENLIKRVHIGLLLNDLDEHDTNYMMAVAGTLGDHWSGKNVGKQFEMILTHENIISKLNDVTHRAITAAGAITQALQQRIFTATLQKEYILSVDGAMKKLTASRAINITVSIEKLEWEICECGTKLSVVPELSEMHCTACGRVETLIGTVFRDDQYYLQEGQKTKHGGYDTSRHYKFWIERLQALEPKMFDDAIKAKIEYILERDRYDRSRLTCANIRTIIKDPLVDATILNDHAPKLVVTFGGPAPPRLTYQEDRVLSARFSQAMSLYDIVNPAAGNKPYYPYFIYKLVEEYFKGNAEKLRLLDYIHLQSRDTVAKNDGLYEKMAQIAEPGTGIVYTPTDPGGRL